ncbi:MAG: DUF2924 domain-containing protein [Candidatus Sulfotelmatobacter sp.]|jgi:hypothetical protein
MANLSISDRLLTLPNLQKPALFELWQQLFNTDPPERMRKELLVQFLAYRLQEKEFGGLSDRSHRRVRELASSIEVTSRTSGFQKLAIKPGTRLIREWKDQVHVVNVEEGNYEYRGARYESLSEIARLITGTRWSGPLFFGLKDKGSKASKEAA